MAGGRDRTANFRIRVDRFTHFLNLFSQRGQTPIQLKVGSILLFLRIGIVRIDESRIHIVESEAQIRADRGLIASERRSGLATWWLC